MDPLEDRIRQGLSADSWRLPADEELLGRVHSGAARRRRRRAATGAAASLVVLAGLAGSGAFVLGDLGSPDSQMTANDSAGSSESDRRQNEEQPDTLSSPDDQDTDDKSDESAPDPDSDSSATPDSTRSDRVPSGFRPMSLTATSTDSYWVLGDDPKNDRRTPLARTEDGGDTFGVTGQVPAPSATVDSERSADTVSDVRFVDDTNGWAYGGALWATHDGGTSWSQITAVPGTVQLLEAAGGNAYAVVDQDGSYSLWRSPAGEDGWEQRAALNDPSDLTAVQNLVMVTDRNGDETQLVVSANRGESFERHQSPCEASLDAGGLSATQEALWLTCPSGTSITVQVSTDNGETWNQVQPEDSLSNAGVATGAQDGENLIAAANGEVLRLDADGGTDKVGVKGLSTPIYVGFTDPAVGYVLDSDGDLFRTEDSGASWHPVQVN